MPVTPGGEGKPANRQGSSLCVGVGWGCFHIRSTQCPGEESTQVARAAPNTQGSGYPVQGTNHLPRCPQSGKTQDREILEAECREMEEVTITLHIPHCKGRGQLALFTVGGACPLGNDAPRWLPGKHATPLGGARPSRGWGASSLGSKNWKKERRPRRSNSCLKEMVVIRQVF